MNLRKLSDSELRAEFEARKKALIEVRNEIDRRESLPVASVDFTKYVGDGIE